MLLDGMKITTFCHFLQGPAAMQYLADMGADMIKIEPPQGAWERHWAGANRVKVNGVSAFYLSANRNARSLALDLKKPAAQAIAMRVIQNSHAITENYRPGALDRLNLGYDAVKAVKPDIIYASASGYGTTGPYATRPGQDLLIQAMSGLVAATGGREKRFTAPGAAIADQHGAALFALGIVGAYAKWLRTGEGTRVESSLLASGIDLQTESLVTYFAADGQDKLFDRDSHLGTWFHEAPYGIYALKDAHVAISINPPEKVARALKSDEIAALIGRNTYFERDVYAKAVAKVLSGLTFAEMASAFESESMWFTKVDTFDDLVENPQVLYNGTFMDFDVMGTPLKLVNHPNRYDGEGAEIRHMAFHQGQHSRMILDECGYSSKEIAQFHEDEIVFSPKE
jgi:crotonobetainyl-CoA:carnitine CoA-transferase CaiB-like acyl-CoA transferase